MSDSNISNSKIFKVGYGKTAITVGLIDSSPDSIPGEGLSPEDLSGKHPVKATLIIVPSQLMGQWPKEIKKFAGDALKVKSTLLTETVYSIRLTST